MTAMEFRQYDSALGRFNSVDKLAEMSHNISPYRFAFNNPVVWSDPSGLFETRKEARAYRREHDLRGGITKQSDGSFAINDKKNGVSYAKGDDSNFESTDSNDNDGVIESVLVNNESQNSNQNSNALGSSISTGLWGVNTAIGGLSTYMVVGAQFHKMNEAWHVTKTAGTSFFWQSRWQNPGAMYHRANQVAKVRNARNLSTKLTKVAGVLLVADIALSGDIKPSHVINGIMLGASATGVGSIVSGAWFIADFGTMGVNYLINGEAKGLGDMIDESSFEKSTTIKMYEGAY